MSSVFVLLIEDSLTVGTLLQTLFFAKSILEKLLIFNNSSLINIYEKHEVDLN